MANFIRISLPKTKIGSCRGKIVAEVEQCATKYASQGLFREQVRYLLVAHAFSWFIRAAGSNRCICTSLQKGILFITYLFAAGRVSVAEPFFVTDTRRQSTLWPALFINYLSTRECHETAR